MKSFINWLWIMIKKLTGRKHLSTLFPVVFTSYVILSGKVNINDKMIWIIWLVTAVLYAVGYPIFNLINKYLQNNFDDIAEKLLEKNK